MKDNTTETEAQVREQNRVHAVEAFKGHVLTKLGPNEWHCGKPGDSAYHFFVICRPGVVIVYGDLGDWTLHMYEAEPIRWIPAGVQDPQYLFEKVHAAPADGMKCWYLKDAEAFLHERIAEEAKDAAPLEPGEEREASAWEKALQDIADDEYSNEPSRRTFMEACREHGLDDMYSIGVGFTGRAWWLHSAMTWFEAAERASRLTEMAAASAPGGAA